MIHLPSLEAERFTLSFTSIDEKWLISTFINTHCYALILNVHVCRSTLSNCVGFTCVLDSSVMLLLSVTNNTCSCSLCVHCSLMNALEPIQKELCCDD